MLESEIKERNSDNVNTRILLCGIDLFCGHPGPYNWMITTIALQNIYFFAQRKWIPQPIRLTGYNF